MLLAFAHHNHPHRRTEPVSTSILWIGILAVSLRRINDRINTFIAAPSADVKTDPITFRNF